MPLTQSREERIRQLEGQLSSLKMSSSYGSNCESIARLQLQLAQLYAETNNRLMSDQMLGEASKTLQDPLCPKTRTTEQMLRSVEYYKTHPGILTMQSMPAIYRYLSLIVLLLGYLILYALYYLYRSYLNYNDFLIGILVIFVVSIALNFFIRNQYIKRASQH